MQLLKELLLSGGHGRIDRGNSRRLNLAAAQMTSAKISQEPGSQNSFSEMYIIVHASTWVLLSLLHHATCR